MDRNEFTTKCNEKAPIRLWHIIAEVLGSIAGALFFIDILSRVFYTNIYGLRITMTLLCFILVPSIFAFPIIIKELKLFFIPTFILPLFITAFYYGDYPESILFFCVALAGIGAFGVIAGILICLFRSGKSKAKTILITVGGLVLLTPVLFIGYMSAGAPLHSMFVNRIVREYVAETYSDFDVMVSRTRYNWYGDVYETKIHDRSDEDIYFEIWYITKTSQYNPTHIIDRYTYGNAKY